MSGPESEPLPVELRPLAALVRERLAPTAHGHMPRWLAALDSLPALGARRIDLGDRVTVEGAASGEDRQQLIEALMAFHPWRKGPFRLFGVDIDTEWRSDWKWRRVVPHLASLRHHRVLDVGCGNGYFGWRMLEAGADQVVGVDPTLVFCLQHRAVNGFIRDPRNVVLPVRFEELPPAEFDSVFSMGVIYHRRDPQDHAAGLFRHTRPGGQVVLESLVVEGQEPLRPAGRYARMRNVHVIPTPALMQQWLTRAGFVEPVLADVTPTTLDEQRTTGWMRFQSLREALDPADPGRTVEGHPGPVRAVVVARKPV